VTTPREAGFEWGGRLYPWYVGQTGKDLMLIDRLTQMSISEFFQAVEDNPDRGSLLLAMVALALRHGHPDWSVDKIVRIVSDLDMSDLEFTRAEDQDEEETVVLPPPTPPPSGEPSRSQNNGSSRSSTPQEDSPSPTSSAAPT
jgi:hypothetical protein